MAEQKFPLLRVRRTNGEIDELMVGPCAASALVAIVIVVMLALLLLTGVVRADDVVPVLRALVLR